MPVLDIARLTEQLRVANARWQPRATPQSLLSDVDKRAILGCILPPPMLAAGPGAPPPGNPPLPASVDWRNRNGNHVPPVADQRACGSCVSFGTAALVSSMASIEHGQMPDLSEADLHFCSSHGATCGGWSPDTALAQVQSRGIVDEAAFPYMTAFDAPPVADPHDPSVWTAHCRGPNRAGAVRIANHGSVSSTFDRKAHLANVGPVTCAFTVFDDFFSFGGPGVYHHVTGNAAGGHCVEVIGYSDTEGCWICKNSWGTAWGDSGFFKIAYGQCGIDTDNPFWTASGVQLPATHGWSGWENQAGQITSRPSAASWGPNRIDVVARGLDSAVWHRWWDGAAWRGWESLGGLCHGAPAIASWASGRLDVFCIGTDHALYHKWFNGGWSGWEKLGGQLSSEPAAVSWGNNRIDVFARGMDMAMWHLWWDGAGWHGWESLGGGLSSAPAVSSWASGRLDCFVRGYDMAMWHKWWDGAHWSGWESLGGIIADAPAAVSWGPNRIDTFAPGTNQHMFHKWWDGAQWSGWEDLGGVLSSGVGVSSWQSGRLDCFVEGTDSAMYHKWFS